MFTRALVVLLCAVFLVPYGSASTLGPNQSAESEIQPGAIQSYSIALRAGDFVRLRVEEKQLGVTITLLDPDAQEIATAGAPITAERVMRLSAIAERDGLHRVDIRPLKSNKSVARYALVIEDVRVSGPDDRIRVDAENLVFEGERLRSDGSPANLRAALARYEKAIPMVESLDDRWLLAAIYHLGGLVHDSLNQYRESIEWYERALTLRQQQGDARGEGETLANMAVAHRVMGNAAPSLELYERALGLARASGDVLTESSVLHNIGTARWFLGEFSKGAESYREAIRLRRLIGNRAGEADSLTGLALALRNMGETQQALDMYADSLALKRELGDRRGGMTTLHNMGVAYSVLGQFRKALELYDEALALAREFEDRQWESAALVSSGIAYRFIGENEKALESFQKSLELRKALGNKRGQAEVLSNMGLLLELGGNLAAALQLYELALPLNREILDRRGEAFTIGSIASIQGKLGDAERAIGLYGQALQVQRAIGDENGAAQSLLGMADVLRKEGRLAESRENVEEAIATIESLRARIGIASLRSTYRALHEDHYALHVDVLMQLHRKDPAAGYDALALISAERARARTLRETLAIGNIRKLPNVDPALIERRRALLQQMSTKERARSGVAGAKDKQEQLAVLEKEIRQLIEEHEAIEARLRASSPGYAAISETGALSLESIRGLLDDDTSLLFYSLGRERSYAWILTRSSLRSVVLPPAKKVEDLARQTHALISAGRRRDLEAPLRRSIDELSAAILEPVYRQIATTRVVIVPDGALQYAPFAALTLPLKGTVRQPLIARHEIVTLPSASVLELLRARGKRTGTAAIAVFADPVLDAADPRVTRKIAGTQKMPHKDLLRSGEQSGMTSFQRLPYTSDEADGILAVARSHSSLKATGFRANRESVVNADLHEFGIIHFATHGLLNNETPELSGIVLSLVDEQGEPQDGFLRVHEICGLDLDAELVVVSACRTALGKEIRGEGLIGITRGFMLAGARKVVATLWDVRDQATAELMKRFYRGMLEEKLTAAAALRAAQLSLRDNPRWQSPFYWAPFVIQGDWK